MKINRLLVTIAVCLIVGSLISAAGAKEQTEQPKDVTLTIYARAYTFAQDAPWVEAKAELQRRHPDINFTFVEEGFGWADMRTKFLTSAAGGPPPDVMMTDIIWLGEFVENGLLVDVTDRVAKWSEWEDVVDTYRNATYWNGKVYGTWLNTDVRVLVYNKDLFKAAGLDPNAPPKDWNELQAMALKATNAPNYYGFGFPATLEDEGPMKFFANLFSNGGQILTDDNKQAAFNSAEGVAALEALINLVTAGATPTSIVSGKASDIDNGVFQGKFAMASMTKAYGLAKDLIPNITPEEYKQRFGVAPIPHAPGGVPSTMAGGYLLTIPAGSKNHDLAWELITLAAGADLQFEYTAARGYVPTFKSLMARGDDYAQVDPYFSIILEQLPHANFRPSIPEWTEISAEIQNALQACVLGRMTPKQALDLAAANVNKILTQ
ncbi:MAG: extracellular solute-binding protein [Sphaerochaetaceae bacterium]